MTSFSRSREGYRCPTYSARGMGATLVSCLLVAATLLASVPALGADTLVEGEALALQKQAIQDDCLNVRYPEAIKKLAVAIGDCGVDKCNTTLRGALYRDLGAMLILNGLVDDGRVAFAKALGLDSSLDLDPSYKNQMLERLWSDAKKKAGSGAATEAGDAAGGRSGAAANAAPSGSASSTQNPDTAKPRDNAPDSSDCPPDFPGCHAPKKPGGEKCAKGSECETGTCTDGKCTDKVSEGEVCEKDSECTSDSCSNGKCAAPKKATDEACEGDDECSSGICQDSRCGVGGAKNSLAKPRKIWIGIAGSLDIIALPTAENVCVHTNHGTATLNTAGYECVDPSTGANFPGTDATANGNIKQGSAASVGDGVNGGAAVGNLRLMASFDYALNMNVLLGARAGYVLFTDPASEPGRAFAPIHLEARATFLLGKDALARPVAPTVLVAVGAGEFDASIGMGVQMKSGTSRRENAWLTAGPLFGAVGAGARFLLGPTVAATVAVKGEGAFGGAAGFLLGFAPEFGMQLGL
jgi:hypothetical protein